MSTLRIDADALFRAITASSYKLLAYHLDLETGEVIARTMQPDEVADAPQGPSVKPLPKMGGDLTPKKDAAPFGPPPVTVKKKLFSDADLPRKPAFEGGFWQREERRKPDIFAGGGFRRESGTKKLAEIFGEPAPKKKADPFAQAQAAKPHEPAPAAGPTAAAPAVDETTRPRIPVAGEQQHLEWVAAFARGFGDPEIRDQILAALKTAKPFASLERVLRKHQRMSQQWELYFRRRALDCAEAWLATLNVQWELVEPEGVR
ncbi:MAG: hypothetical protein NTW87_33260 [Planctomycetota bacterium]|nr:hypothetical protein [Planctomycetota bacterium]